VYSLTVQALGDAAAMAKLRAKVNNEETLVLRGADLGGATLSRMEPPSKAIGADVQTTTLTFVKA
jgi:hypothetical protein